MKKLLLLLLILIIPLASANIEKIHEDWHPYQDQITKEGIIYDFFIQETNPDILRFNAGSFQTILTTGQCQKNEEYTYCYLDFDYEHSKVDISPSGNLVPAIKILIEKETITESEVNSDFKLHATHTQRTELDQTNNLSIKLENNGDTTIRNAKITIKMPEGLEINTDSLIKLQTIIQSPQIQQIKEPVEHLLTYSPKKSGTHDILITIDYEEEQQKKQITKTLKVEVPKPYTITTSIPTKAEIGQTFRYQVELENKIQTKINITATLNYPINLAVQKVQGLSQTATRTHTTTKTIDPGKKETLYIEFRPINNQPITIDGNLKIITEKETFEESLQKQLQVEFKTLTQTLEVDKVDITPNSNYRVTYKLTNNNNNLELTDITTNIQGLIQQEITTPKIKPGETLTIYEETLKAPDIQENKAYQINATTRFRVSGVLNTIQDQKTINVLGDTTPIIIDVQPTKTTAKPNETITIITNIRNAADTPIQTLTITDEFNQEVVVTGRITNIIDLQGKEQKQAYTYQLQIPTNTTNNLIITTKAKNNQYETSKKTIINIDSEKIIQQPSDIQNDEKPVEKGLGGEAEYIRHTPKENFVVRTYRKFSDFIRGIIS